MKKEQIELCGILIRQNKEGLLSLTDLQKVYDLIRFDYGWTEKNIHNLIQRQHIKDRIKDVLNLNGIKIKDISAKSLKDNNLWQTVGSRGTNNVMCHKYIWLILCLELNPIIYGMVYYLFTDIELESESTEDVFINHKVFGKHIPGIRSIASEKDLQKIADIKRLLSSVTYNSDDELMKIIDSI